MADQELAGVVVAAGPDGRRSTTALGQAVLAAALRPVDEPGAAAVERSTSWRSDYPAHFRRLVEAGLPDPKSWLTVAESGLAELDRQLAAGPRRRHRGRAAGGADRARRTGARHRRGRRHRRAGARARRCPTAVGGCAGTSSAARSTAWIAAGVAEPSRPRPVEDVLDAPRVAPAGGHHGRRARRRRGDGRRCRACCAGAPPWPRSTCPARRLWQRVLAQRPRAGAGRLLVPAERRRRPARTAPTCSPRSRPSPTGWPGSRGRLVLGNYVVRGRRARTCGCPAAADVLGPGWLRQRPDDLALAFLATPTDVFAVPGDAVEHADRAGTTGVGPAPRKLSRRRCARSARGRLLQPRVPARRGPRDQRQPGAAAGAELRAGQAAAAVAGGGRPGAPGRRCPSTSPRPTRTRSVVKNRALAAAFAGAHRFGVEVFEPATANTLMAALLVHDLDTGGRPAAGAPLAGRGVRRRPRRTVAGRRTRRAACSGSPCSSERSAGRPARPERSPRAGPAGSTAGRGHARRRSRARSRTRSGSWPGTGSSGSRR